ncbi:hypothetical protein RB628_35240 [Streptomyces sp. ADMS]|uniref:hypothetical protein n=1 Tax=Streptomyces sp. ADMS TaxID=3071415 RepID=UPI00296E915A|nr:hypothetical protein [Streptomyces sp. ADMS]MDW4910445.1 hypothetical protein [Streptomyces sp. ADMS]
MANPATIMVCKNCGHEMYRDGACEACGWRIGWVPVAQHSDGTSTFVREPRHKFFTASILLTTLVGVIAFIAGVAEGAAAGIIFGPLMVIAGVAAWKKTRLGKLWQGLPPGDRCAALPGLAIGTVIALMLIPVTIMIVAVFAMLPKARDL